MKFKKIILISLAIASSVVILTTGIYHQSIKNERVQIKILEGDLDALDDNTLCFYDDNSIVSKNIVEISKEGMQRYTRKNNDTTTMTLYSKDNYGENIFYKTNSNSKFKKFNDTLARRNLHGIAYNIDKNNTPYWITRHKIFNQKITQSTLNLKLFYYENEIFKEKNLNLKVEDIIEGKHVNNLSVEPLAISKEDNVIKLISTTYTERVDSDGNSFEDSHYDYIEYDIATDKYSIKNFPSRYLENAYISGNSIYVLGDIQEENGITDNRIQKYNTNNFKEFEIIFSQNELNKKYYKENIIIHNSANKILNIPKKRFEIITSVIDQKTGSLTGEINFELIDIETKKRTEYKNIPVFDEDELRGYSNLCEVSIKNDKLFISYKPNSDVYPRNHSEFYMKIIDLKTKESLLKLKINSSYDSMARVVNEKWGTENEE